MRKQRGFLTIAAILVVVAVVGSAGAYHWLTVSGLKSTIAERDTEIKKLKAEVASLSLRNLALETENKEFKALTEKQNTALEEIKKARDFAQAEYEKARKAAAEAKVASEGRIKKILSTTVASAKDACAAWEKLINEYVAERQKTRATQ